MQIRDDNGAEISSKICNIIGADGGSMPYARDHLWPSYGMLTDVAYRWDVVCDFSAYTGRVRTLCFFCDASSLNLRTWPSALCTQRWLHFKKSAAYMLPQML